MGHDSQTDKSKFGKNMHEFNQASLGLALGGGANICWRRRIYLSQINI